MEAGCGHARMKLPAKYLSEVYEEHMEVETSMIMDPNKWVTMLDEKRKLFKKNYHLTIHQRQYGTPNLQNFRFLRNKLKIPCVYEIDDFLHGVHPDSSAYYAYNKNIHKERFENIDNYLRESDAITVTTEYLKRMYKDYNKHIYVLPNFIDVEDVYSEENYKNKEKNTNRHEHDGEIWIGWAGSNTHLPDLKIASEAIVKIVNKYSNVKLVLGGWDGYFRDKDGNIHYPEKNPWKNIPENKKIVISWAKNMKDYSKMLTNFDIGIAPLEDNDFNRCKSDIKYKEYAGAGVPCIASSVEPYKNTIKDGEDGLLVKSKGATFNSWYKKIKKMVEDRDLRIKIGKKARERAVKEFDIKKNIYRWKDVYSEIILRGV